MLTRHPRLGLPHHQWGVSRGEETFLRLYGAKEQDRSRGSVGKSATFFSRIKAK
jgi:hypothetical protein